MAQQHLDRLTAVDASFLAQEGPASHMHIGGIVLCEGPAPGFDEMLDHVRTRLHLVPRYRQRLAQPPLDPHAGGRFRSREIAEGIGARN